MCADFTSIKLKDLGKNRVKVFDVKGMQATDFYKVSCSYADGYSSVGTLTYSWPDALTKAKAADKILRKRLKNLNLQFDEIRNEFVGYNACHETLAPSLPEDKINEIMLRIAVRHTIIIPLKDLERNCSVDINRSAFSYRFCGRKTKTK